MTLNDYKIGVFDVELTIFDEKCGIFIGGDVQKCTGVRMVAKGVFISGLSRLY